MPVLRARLPNVHSSFAGQLIKSEGNGDLLCPLKSQMQTRARPLERLESHSVNTPLRSRALSLTASGRCTRATSKRPIRKSIEATIPIQAKRSTLGDKGTSAGDQKKVQSDPYSFDAVLDSDDEKENIDPQVEAHVSAGKSTTRGQKNSARSRNRSRKHSTFAPSGSSSRYSLSLSRVTADAERIRNATATIRLPLPHPPNETCLSATPIFTYTPLASTPSVQPTGNSSTSQHRHIPTAPSLISPVLGHPVHCNPQASRVGKVKEPVHPQPHVRISLELFEDDVILDKETPVAGTPKERSTHSSSKSCSRGSRSSDSKDDYVSWLDEFNAQLEQFESHNLTVELDASKGNSP